MKKSFSYAPTPFKKMPKGTTKMAVENAVYLTDTDDKGNKITTKTLNARIKEVETIFLELFGGYNYVDLGKGEFISKSKKIMKERVIRIVSFAEGHLFMKNRKKLEKWLLAKKKEWRQESMSYEFEGDLYYI